MRKLLLGLATGLSLGLLFAPESGKKTRTKLAQSDKKIEDILTLFKEAGVDASEEVQKFLQSEEVQNLITQGSKGLDTIVQKGTELSENGKEELAHVFETVAKTIAQQTKKVNDSVVNAATQLHSSAKEKLTTKKKGFFS